MDIETTKTVWLSRKDVEKAVKNYVQERLKSGTLFMRVSGLNLSESARAVSVTIGHQTEKVEGTSK